MGELAKSSGGRRGREEPLARAAADAAQAAPPATPALLARGRERYGIACEPCHSPVGDGDGLVARRGFPRPPDYAEPRLRAASDRELYDAITHGYGVMPALADRLGPQDRWAVVAYVRALQLARSAPLAELPPALREAVRAMPRASAASEAG
jgi:mono/diheme cytochrome c family protein